MSGDMMLDGSYASRISHKRIASCMVQHSNNSWVDGILQLAFLYLVVSGLLCMAYPNGCRHKIFIPAEAKAIPHEGAWALVTGNLFCTHDGLLLCMHPIPSGKSARD